MHSILDLWRAVDLHSCSQSSAGKHSCFPKGIKHYDGKDSTYYRKVEEHKQNTIMTKSLPFPLLLLMSIQSSDRQYDPHKKGYAPLVGLVYNKSKIPETVVCMHLKSHLIPPA